MGFEESNPTPQDMITILIKTKEIKQENKSNQKQSTQLKFVHEVQPKNSLRPWNSLY